LPEAQAMLGGIAAQYDYDWAEAGRRFQRALSYTPISSDVHRMYGFPYLVCIGHPAEAVEHLLQSILEDPLFPIARISYSMCLIAAGQLQTASEELVKLQELDPSFWPAHWVLSDLYWLQGDRAQALIHAEKAYKLASWNMAVCAGFAGALAAAGQPERAAELIAKVPSDAYGAPMALTTYFDRRGDLEQVAVCYAKGIEERDPRALPTHFMLGPEFRASVHWPRLAKMMKLPQTMTSRSF